MVKEVQPVIVGHSTRHIGSGIEIPCTVAPIVHIAAGIQGHCIIPAGCDGDDVAQIAHLNGIISTPIPNRAFTAVGPRTTDIGLIVVSVTQLAMLIITPGIDGTVGSQGVAGEITSSDSYDVVEIAHITVLDTATNLLRCSEGPLNADPLVIIGSGHIVGMVIAGPEVIGNTPAVGNTQLAIVVGTPGPDGAVLPENQGMLFTRDYHGRGKGIVGADVHLQHTHG